MQKFLNKVPWGVIAGIFGIFSFYLTAIVFGVHFVFVQVNGQTGQETTLFDTWWQTLLFILDIVCILLFIGAIVCFIKKKIESKGGKSNEKAA